MVWKQDLAKLKQELKAAETTPPKAPPAPKAVPKPAEARPIEEEDALFLAAMGQRPQPKPRPKAVEAGEAPQPAPPAPAPEADFLAEMQTLKGMKAVAAVPTPTKAPAPAPKPAPEPEPSTEAEPVTPPPAPEAPPARSQPLRIQLAAGMAIEVDGTLDLRGHSAADARERLKERIQDGVFLGWRSLHVLLGPSEELQTDFEAFILSPAAAPITRFAQAPIPMGGAQAWILYYPAH